MVYLHFDLDAAEKTLRSALRITGDQANALATDYEGRELVRLQTGLDDVLVAATLWHLRCLNEQAKPEIAIQALGFVLGNVIIAFAERYEDEHEVVDGILAAVDAAIDDAFGGADPETTLESCALIHSVEGGRA